MMTYSQTFLVLVCSSSNTLEMDSGRPSYKSIVKGNNDESIYLYHIADVKSGIGKWAVNTKPGVFDSTMAFVGKFNIIKMIQ